MKRPYLLKVRDGRWHYRLAGELNFHSTGIRVTGRSGNRGVAEAWVLEHAVAARSRPAATDLTLAEYAGPFFRPESDPRVIRMREEGREVGAEYLVRQRQLLEHHVLKDPLAGLRLLEITRADLLDFRRRLLAREGEHRNTANKVMAALKVILKEAVYLQDLPADPTAGIGAVKENRVAPGVLTAGELRALFPREGLGPWQDRRGYTCFLLAATTGMRRGEVLALRWSELDLEGRTVRIERAWKRYEHRAGSTKSGRPRVAPLPVATVEALIAYRESVIRHHPDDLVFCYDDGGQMGESWWEHRFHAAITAAGIQPAGRRLVPHSLRHSLATILAAEEYDREKIRSALGWADEAIRKHYTHLGAEHLRGQAEIVDRLLTGN